MSISRCIIIFIFHVSSSHYLEQMMTHHFVMTSSLRIKILKIDKFGDFSCDIDYNSRTDIFRDVFSFIINHWDPRRP